MSAFSNALTEVERLRAAILDIVRRARLHAGSEEAAMTVTFDVVGHPAPQGSHSAVLIGGRARLIEGKGSTGRATHRNWRAAGVAA